MKEQLINMKNKGNVGQWAAGVLTVIFVVFIGYTMIKQFIEIEPGFANIGIQLLIALVAAAILFIKFGSR